VERSTTLRTGGLVIGLDLPGATVLGAFATAAVLVVFAFLPRAHVTREQAA